MLTIVVIAIVVAVGLRGRPAGERQLLLERARTGVHAIGGIARRIDLDSLRDELRMSPPLAMLTWAVLLSGVALFVLCSGGSFGPRTTNGEWWRLATSMLGASTMWLLVVNAAALLTVAPAVGRRIGMAAFGIVYLMTGLVAGALNLRLYPVALTSGASAPIFGLLGVLVASRLWNRVRIPAAAAIVVFNMFGDDLAFAAQGAAFSAGFVSGLLFSRRDEPSAPQIGIVAIASAALVVALAFPLRGIADVRPEIARIVELEDRTAGAYQTTYEKYVHGKVTGESLAQQIDRTILPDLQEEDGRVKALQRVPPEHQQLVADAEEYLRLRIESWRLRARALRQAGKVPDRDVRLTGVSADAAWRIRAEAQYRANLVTFGSVERAERAAQEVFGRIKP